MTKELAAGAILLEEEAVGHLRLNAPARRNAMSKDMWHGLVEALDYIEAQSQISVLVLSGEGDHFCAGADISEFEETYRDLDAIREYNHLIRLAQKRLRDCPLPTIAKISGACVGGGCGLALSCDVRFVSSSTKMGITPSRLGLAYSPADCQQLAEKVGYPKAKELLMSARLLSADEALKLGLADFSCEMAELSQAVNDYASQLAQRSPTSIRAIKHIIHGLAATPAIDDPTLHRVFEDTFSSQDFAEGRRAFIEKRTPVFTGR